MATTTNFGWTTPDDTALVKDGAAAIRTLGSSIDTSFLDLKGGTSGQVLSKNSNTDLDFAWVDQDDSNAIQNALLTTTGDTIYASGASTPARLAVGTTGQVLTVSGGVPTWATPAAAGGMTLLSTTTLSGTSTTVSSISQSYKHLLVIGSAITLTSADRIRINPNSNASITDQLTLSAATTLQQSNSNTLFPVANIGAAASSSSDFATNIMLYSSTTTKKPFNSFGTLADLPNNGFSLGRINTDTAISSLQFTTNSGSANMGGTIRIYGVN